jgi:putative selenate reductase FAD-binding subunit
MITEILRPKSAREAVRAKSTPGSAYLGGGTWLNSGKASTVTRLVSLEHLHLGLVECDRGRCVIGASVTLQQIIDSAQAPRALRAAAGLVASRTLRNMKTIGGSLGLRAPDSAIIAVLVALRAEVSVAERRALISVEAYLANTAEHLILSVIIPDVERPCALRSLSRTSHAPRSLLVALSLLKTNPVIVVSDCQAPLARLSSAERALAGKPLPAAAEIQRIVNEAFSPAEDIHASSAYKRYLAGVFVADCLAELAASGAQK